jgi:hypothetical protein
MPYSSIYASHVDNATIIGEGVPVAADDVPRWPELPPQDLPPRRRLAPPALRPRQPPRRLRSSVLRKAAVGAALITYSWFAAGTEPFTISALLIVLVPGVALFAIVCIRPPKRTPPPDRLDLTGFSYWAIAIGALFEWEASAFKDGAPSWHPALTTLIDPVLGTPPVKAAGILIWLLAGWALVRR